VNEEETRRAKRPFGRLFSVPFSFSPPQGWKRVSDCVEAERGREKREGKWLPLSIEFHLSLDAFDAFLALPYRNSEEN